MNTPKLRALLPLLPALLGCEPAGQDGDADGSDEGEAFCGLTPDGPAEPWFALQAGGDPLASGDDLAVQCGFQGAFMVPFDATLGGFEPTGDSVRFQISLDVEGFNVGPNGHFAQSTIDLFVGCCDGYYGCYYQTTYFIIFPPDLIDDPSVIHGLPGKLTVNMDIPQGDVLQEVDVTMWAMPDGNWDFCLNTGYFSDPLPLATTIPIPG